MEDDIPNVAGLRLIERTDRAGSGEVWRARVTGGAAGERGDPLPGELAGVGDCYVRLLRLPVDDAMRKKAQAVAQDLLALDDPGLVLIREARLVFDGLALVYAPLPLQLLPLHLLARRRQLSAGEIVTLGVALAWALAAAHGAGVAHGRIRDADVLLDPAGRPVLAGVGIMAVLGSGGRAPDDVRALVRMLASLLDHESNGAARVLAALAEPPPTAAELGARLAEAAPATPIDLGDQAAAGPEEEMAAAPSRGRSQKVTRTGRPFLGGLLDGLLGRGARQRFGPRRRALRLLAAAVGVLVLSGVIGWMSVPGPPHAAAQSPPAAAAVHAVTPPSVDWAGELSRLDTAWAQAFARGDPALLASVDAPSSAAYRTDSAAVQALRDRQLHARGLSLRVQRVSVRSVSEHRAVLLVADRRAAYDLLDANGSVVEHVPERGPTQHTIILQPVAPPDRRGWRIESVSDAAPS